MACNDSNKVDDGGTQCCGSAKGERICADGVRYVSKQMEGPAKKAILACEGGCIKGEIARVAANILAYKLQRDTTVRICLGDAATGNSGFVDLIRSAPEVIAVEGCPLQCGTEIVRKRIPALQTTVINASELYEFDRTKYFEIFDMPRAEVEEHAQKVADHIEKLIVNANGSCDSKGECKCC